MYEVIVMRGDTLVFHAFPISKALADWYSAIIPRITLGGRRQRVIVKAFA